MTTTAPSCCSILPPYLLERLVEHPDQQVAEAARQTLVIDQALRAERETLTERGAGESGLLPRRPGLPEQVAAPTPPATARVTRSIYDAKHGATLPGTLVRAEGKPAVGDSAVNQAYDGLGDTFALYWDVYRRNSLDGKGLPLVASVHYQTGYDNAFWDGQQMVFGDGDGKIFTGFTGSLDVIGHELTHGVTQYTAGLAYVAQSGALNESISDVFGSLVKQRALKQTAAQADWLIGAGLFTKAVHGVALRSMKAPGTAYDDPQLGKDPQPATMAGYIDLPHDSQHDNGGVHTNSGIPNHAFYLAAVGIGGNAWEGAGQVWYDVLTGGTLAKDADFAAFAAATVAAATKRFGASSSQAAAVAQAWSTVGVGGTPSQQQRPRQRPQER